MRSGDTFLNKNLSHREEQILRLAARGLTDKEIASKSEISLCTVRTYWERLRQKMKASNRAAAIAIYLNSGFASERALVNPVETELIRDAISVALGGILVVSPNAEVAALTAKAEQLIGADAEFVVGKPLRDVFHDDPELFFQAYRQVSEGLAPACTVPAFAKVGNQRSPLLHVTLRPMARTDGRHTVLFVQDAVEDIEARRFGPAGQPADM